MLWKLGPMCNSCERWWDFQEVRIGTEAVTQWHSMCSMSEALTLILNTRKKNQE